MEIHSNFFFSQAKSINKSVIFQIQYHTLYCTLTTNYPCALQSHCPGKKHEIKKKLSSLPSPFPANCSPRDTKMMSSSRSSPISSISAPFSVNSRLAENPSFTEDVFKKVFIVALFGNKTTWSQKSHNWRWPSGTHDVGINESKQFGGTPCRLKDSCYQIWCIFCDQPWGWSGSTWGSKSRKKIVSNTGTCTTTVKFSDTRKILIHEINLCCGLMMLRDRTRNLTAPIQDFFT